MLSISPSSIELLFKRLYDISYAKRWIKDLNALEKFVEPYTPEWAKGETGISADDLRSFVRELSDAKPSVLWHPGWNMARYSEFLLRLPHHLHHQCPSGLHRG